MRRIYYLLIAGALVFGVTSCNEKNEGENKEPVTENTNTTKEDTKTPESGKKEVALNPPHGQPGHICEIPVGQPLPDGANTAKKAPAGNVQLKTPLMKDNQKLNPPHGQPGHRCEVPVGQPLP